MKTKFIKYLIDIDEYIAKHQKYFQTFFWKLKDKYNFSDKQIKEIFQSFNEKTMLLQYFEKADIDILFKEFMHNNFTYICIGNISMYNKFAKKYGDYFVILQFKNNKFIKYKLYLTINEFLNFVNT